MVCVDDVCTPPFALWAIHVTLCRWVCVWVQGFREKNSEVMRQDIIDVLTTSKAYLIRAMIGLPTYAVHRWHLALLKYQAVMALMGPLHRGTVMGGALNSASPQKLCRAGSTPLSVSSTPLRAGSTPSGAERWAHYCLQVLGV